MNHDFTVYKASAGSGKTFRLALEYIALALRENAPDCFKHILAVTFTNKATTEMKDRILQQLYNLSRGGLDEGFLNAVTQELPGMPVEEISRRAGRVLEAILHDYDNFRVETIDSFFQFMLGNLAHEIGLTRGFQINLNDDEVTGHAVDRLLLGLERHAHARKGVAADKWVFEYMKDNIDEDLGWDIARSLKKFASSNLSDEAYIENENELREWFASDKRFDDLKRALQQTKAKAEESIKQAAEDFLSHEDESLWKKLSWIKEVRAFANKLETGDFDADIGKRVDNAASDYETLIKKQDKKKQEIAECAQLVSSWLKVLIETFQENIKSWSTSRAMLKTINQMRLLGLIGHEVDSLNKETGYFLLSHTPYLFNKLVENDDASFVFERVGTTFRHVMVDEFQDTARPQWSNIRRLLIENLSTGGKSLIVGDVKQSIYRWRGGDWKILANIDKEIGGVRYAPPLNTNFRSGKAIVNFNNRLFPLAAQSIDEITAEKEENDSHARQAQELYADVRQLTRPDAPEGYIRVATGQEMADDELFADLYDSIVRLHHDQHVPYSKMGILVRRKKEAAQLIDYFSQEHPEVPLTSDEAYKLSASPLVCLVISALQFIMSPSDSVAAIQASRIYSQVVQGKPLDFEQCTVLPAPFRKLAEERESLLQMPLYELCERILSVLGIKSHESAGQAGQSAYLFYFLDRLLNWLETSPSSIPDFIDYWDDTLSEESIPPGSMADSIYITTIHKAKGLAWHTVLLPFCNWNIERNNNDDIMWCSTQELPRPYADIPIMPIRPNDRFLKKSHFSPSLHFENLQQRIDNLNMLYVALTRAQQNMLIWINTTAKGQGKGISDLLVRAIPQLTAPSGDCLPAIEQQSAETAALPGTALEVYEGGSLQQYIKKEVQETSQNPLEAQPAPVGVSLCEGGTHVEFRQSNAARSFIAETDDAPATPSQQAEYIKRGNLLHKLFSMIETAADIDKAIQELSVQGLFDGRSEETAIEKFVAKQIGKPTVAEWFDGSWTLFNECSILTRNAENGEVETWRPDRVMVKGERAVVVDFKFGNPRPSHPEQVANYMRLLQSMGMNPVEGWIWYVYSGELQQVHAD